MEADKQAYEGGATRTKLDIRYDLIPSAALRAIGRRITYGAERHGERNWEAGGVEFVAATKNHLVKHLFDYLDYGRQEDLDAVLCNAAFLAHFRERLVGGA